MNSWTDPQRVVGEFNPKVASLEVLQSSKRLVHPLEAWEKSAIHHLSNKYIKMDCEANQSDSRYASLRFDELEYIFSRCIGGKSAVPRSVTVIGSCAKCLELGGAVKVSANFDGRAHSTERKIHVKYHCQRSIKVKFRGRRGIGWYEYLFGYPVKSI